MTESSKRDVIPMLEAALDPDLEQRRDWHPDELGALLAHQWDASLEVDLRGTPPDRVRVLRRLCEADHLLLKSYGDVFSHPVPPLEILEMIKDYAKDHLARPNQELPEQIARLLYVLSVVVARHRCGRRITSQSDETVRQGAEAILGEPWVTEPVVRLLREGLTAFTDADDATGAERGHETQ